MNLYLLIDVSWGKTKRLRLGAFASIMPAPAQGNNGQQHKINVGDGL
jgi:hypothetical protein